MAKSVSNRARAASDKGDAGATSVQPGVRVDKWLWAARFYKTRSLAQIALENGRVLLGGERIKRSRTVQIGDEIWLRAGIVERTVVVRALSDNRGPAPVAQTLYDETADSIAARAAQRDKRRLFVDPAAAIAAGRPTKRDRRRILGLQDDLDDDEFSDEDDLDAIEPDAIERHSTGRHANEPDIDSPDAVDTQAPDRDAHVD